MHKIAFAQAATHDEITDKLKSSDVNDKVDGIDTRNFSPEHIDLAIKHAPKEVNFDVKRGFLPELGYQMIRHSTVKPLPKHLQGVGSVYVEHGDLEKLSSKEFNTLKKNYNVDSPSVSDSNAANILLSTPEHINHALTTNGTIGHVRHTGGHHLLLSHPAVTDGTLRRVGVNAAKQRNDSMAHTVSVQAAMHKNASKETKEAIYNAAHDTNPYKHQLRRIAERG